MADTCSASLPRLLCIRWSTVSACTGYLLPLRSSRLLVPWPVYELGTFVSVFQATRGPWWWLGCSDTATEKVKFIFPLKQNYQVGKAQALHRTPKICPVSLQGGRCRQVSFHALLFLVPLISHLPWDRAKLWDAAAWLAAIRMCPSLLEKEQGQCCVSSDTWQDVGWAPISEVSSPVRSNWSVCGSRRRYFRQTQWKQEKVFQTDPMQYSLASIDTQTFWVSLQYKRKQGKD